MADRVHLESMGLVGHMDYEGMPVKRTMTSIAAAIVLMIATMANAQALSGLYYCLGSNGCITVTVNAFVTIEDTKAGDVMYARYGWTSDVCGSVGDACAPSSST